MTDYLKGRFSVSAPISDAYADNYEKTFGHKGPKRECEPDALRATKQVGDDHLVQIIDLQMQALAHVKHAQSQPLPSLESRPYEAAPIALSELEKWRDDLQMFMSRREFDTLHDKYELAVGRTLEAIKLAIQASHSNPNK